MLTEKEKNELRKVIDKGGPEAASAASALFDYYLSQANRERCSELAAAKAPLAAVEN